MIRNQLSYKRSIYQTNYISYNELSGIGINRFCMLIMEEVI